MTARFTQPLFAACAALALLAGSAVAQTPPAAAAPTPPPQTMPQTAPAQPAAPDAAPPVDDNCAVNPGDERASGSDTQMLTDQLEDCESILVPQTDGDPEMDAPVPDADPGTTPVIPPGTVPAQPAQPN